MPMNGTHSYKDSEVVEMVNGRDKGNYSFMGSKQARTTCSLTIVVLFIVSMILVVVGITLIIVSSSRKNDCKENENDNTRQTNLEYCGFSKEAKRAGFDAFLTEMQREYFSLHPHQSYHDPVMEDVEEVAIIQDAYKPFDPRPSNLKKITDASLALLKKLNALKINTNRLKPRERKTLIQAKHYLKHIFGQTYDMNYYAGDWMMGPNHFCWQPICDIGKDIFYHLDYYKPVGLNGLKSLR